MKTCKQDDQTQIIFRREDLEKRRAKLREIIAEAIKDALNPAPRTQNPHENLDTVA
jgi:hypothetical protein